MTVASPEISAGAMESAVMKSEPRLGNGRQRNTWPWQTGAEQLPSKMKATAQAKVPGLHSPHD